MSTTKEKDFCLGADPEFIMKEGRNLVLSGDYSDVVFNDKIGGFGPDGSHRPFELRPAPARNPIKLVNNLRQIFEAMVQQYPEFDEYTWEAGSMAARQSIGGHVHFGVLEDFKNADFSYQQAARALDTFLAPAVILVEKTSQARSRRLGQNYGFAGDIRAQNHGFEYRVASSWLVSPHVAAAVLCLSKSIVKEFIENKNFRSYFSQQESGGIYRNVVSAINSVDRVFLTKQFKETWPLITKLPDYQKYKPHIDLLHFLVSKKLSWFPKCSMKEAWGIVNPLKIGATAEDDISRDFDLKSIWSRVDSNCTVNANVSEESLPF